MSHLLNLAYARGWNLALTLMVTIVVFQAGDGGFGVMPEAEYDGDIAAVLHTLTPLVPDPPRPRGGLLATRSMDTTMATESSL